MEYFVHPLPFLFEVVKRRNAGKCWPMRYSTKRCRLYNFLGRGVWKDTSHCNRGHDVTMVPNDTLSIGTLASQCRSMKAVPRKGRGESLIGFEIKHESTKRSGSLNEERKD